MGVEPILMRYKHIVRTDTLTFHIDITSIQL
jgi:hypothetical protein